MSVLVASMQRLGLLDASRMRPPEFRESGAPWVSVPRDAATVSLLALADDLIEGRMEVFGCVVPFAEGHPNWNRDPRTGHEIPRTFGLFIDFRHVARSVDVKFLWEVNRHLWWVTVAQAYAVTADARYLQALEGWLDTWLRDCPYPLGANWSSPVEHGIRLINWSLVWHLIGGWDSALFIGPQGQDLRQRWLQSIYQHMHFARSNYSRYSSADNHLIGELAGVYVGGQTWPLWRKCDSWTQEAKRILEEEAERQFAIDGVNREQAYCYHKFSLEFLLAALLCGQSNGQTFSKTFRKRIEAAIEFVAACTDIAGNVPAFGDSDDGRVFCLGYGEGYCSYRFMLAIGARLFGRNDILTKTDSVAETCSWLLPGLRSINEHPDYVHAVTELRRDFSRGGYVLLGRDLHKSQEIRVLFDTGPLGYNRIAGHGHADALSLLVSYAGREYLIDSGTYCYNAEPQLRRYFRGTKAHNTLTVDGEDQSIYGGSFLWLRDVNTRVEALTLGESLDRVVSCHDGYSRLRDPVYHRRSVELDKIKGKLTVIDSLECKEPHDVELRWHLAPQCEITQAEHRFTVTRDNIDLVLELAPEADTLHVLAATKGRPDAWVSKKFYHREPSSVIVLRRRMLPMRKIITTIYFPSANNLPDTCTSPPSS